MADAFIYINLLLDSFNLHLEVIEQRKYDYFKVYITTKIASVVLFYTERKKKPQNTLGVKLWKININLPFFVVFFCHISNNIFTPSCTRLPCFKYPMI